VHGRCWLQHNNANGAWIKWEGCGERITARLAIYLKHSTAMKLLARAQIWNPLASHAQNNRQHAITTASSSLPFVLPRRHGNSLHLTPSPAYYILHERFYHVTTAADLH